MIMMEYVLTTTVNNKCENGIQEVSIYYSLEKAQEEMNKKVLDILQVYSDWGMYIKVEKSPKSITITEEGNNGNNWTQFEINECETIF